MLTTATSIIRINSLFVVGNVKVLVTINPNAPIFLNDKLRANYYLYVKKILKIAVNLKKMSKLMSTTLSSIRVKVKKKITVVVVKKNICLNGLKSLIVCYINNGLRM